jgi:hypothetical protein
MLSINETSSPIVGGDRPLQEEGSYSVVLPEKLTPEGAWTVRRCEIPWEGLGSACTRPEGGWLGGDACDSQLHGESVAWSLGAMPCSLPSPPGAMDQAAYSSWARAPSRMSAGRPSRRTNSSPRSTRPKTTSVPSTTTSSLPLRDTPT